MKSFNWIKWKINNLLAILRQAKKRLFSFNSGRGIVLVTALIIAGVSCIVAAIAGPQLAAWTGKIIETRLITLVTALVVTLLQIPLTISNLFVGVASMVLGVATSPNFITLSYTKLSNPIIRMGWTVTRDLANMGIVLALIAIGLATILKIESYHAKKTLPILIIIALLINFTPVILGVIVDASNILMHYFLGPGIEAGSFVKTFTDQGNYFSDAWAEVFKKSEREPEEAAAESQGIGVNLAPLGGTVALIAFGIIAGFIYLTFALLFILRYIAIWMLVILSPLAFMCYILPATKKYFLTWWQHFLQWCFIGIFAAFFLYLSSGLTHLASGKELLGKTGLVTAQIDEPLQEASIGLTSLINSLLPYGVVIGFLILAFIATMSISAMGASAVINWSKRSQTRAGKWLGGRIAERGIRPTLERMKMKEAAGKISRGIEKAPILRWFLPEAVRKYGQMRPAIEKSQERAKSYSSQTLGHRILKGADTQVDAAADLREMIERGDEQDLYKEAKKLKKWKGKSDQEILADKEFRKRLTRPLQIGQRGGILNSKFLRSAPRLARLVAGKKWAGPYSTMTEKEAVQEATREARRQHYAQMERESLEDRTLVETTMEKGRDVPESISAQVKKGQETMLNTIDEIFTEYIDNVLSKSKMSAVARDAKQGLPRATEEAWSEFHKHFKSKHQDKDGYFQYVKGQRAREMGWRPGQYKTPEKREERKKETPIGAAAAAGTGPPPPIDTGEARGRKAGPSDTGEARKTKRKKPDVGKE